jgi:hypothetical protein
MGLYAEKLMDAVRNMTGDAPIKTTSTTTLKQPNEGLDIGSLMMMLMMSQMFKKPTAGVGPSDVMNPMDVLGPMSSGGGFGGAMSAVPQGPSVINPATGGALGTNVGLPQILQMLTSLGKIIPGK